MLAVGALLVVGCRIHHTSRPVDDPKQTKAQGRQDPADLAWHPAADRQAYCDATPSTSVVEFDSVVTDLVDVLGNQLSMGSRVTAVSRSYFCQMRQLRVIQRSLTKDALRSLVQVFIHCRLDYCNALLTDTLEIKRLQSVLCATVRLVSGARRRDHITSVLLGLHWLSVR